MDLVFSPTACPDLELPRALELAANSGFKRIQLFRDATQSSPVHPNTSVPMVRERIAAAHFSLAGLNIRNLTGRKADSDEHNLSYNLRQLEWDIHLGRALGLTEFNLRGGARTDEAQEDLIEGTNELLERLPDVRLNLGNQQGNRLQGLADFQAILPALDERARVLLNAGHLLAVDEDVLAFAQAFAGRIAVVHLRDLRGDRPVPFGQGDLPFAELFSILKGAQYAGDFVIELENFDWASPRDALSAARAYVEEAWN